MKIWIVSSDPFLKDFEKIAKAWPAENEVLISAISKFGFGFSGHYNFLKEYLSIKPDVILTDHGFSGYKLISLFNKFTGRKVRLYMFLRGNYWLERRLRHGL
jgi:hypothetical protein